MTSSDELAAPRTSAARGGVLRRAARLGGALWRAWARNWREAMAMYARASGDRLPWGWF